MDGMISDGNFKTVCCNAKTKGYQANDYPYDSGWECICCGKNWSELQIARGQHLEPGQTPMFHCKHKEAHK